MKVVYDDDKMVLFLNKLYIQRIDFTNKEATEKYIKGLLFKLKDNYDLNFSGYYNINIYVDLNYGIIVEIIKEELEYLDYFGNQVEINTKVINDSFLYEVFDYDDFISNDFTIYSYKDKFYLRINNLIDNLGKVIELSNEIIYGYKIKEILRKAVVVR